MTTTTCEGVRVLGPHRQGCWGHEADGYCVAYGEEWRDRSGRRLLQPFVGTRWFRFGCNDPDCESFALVRWDVLAEFVNERAANTSTVPGR